MEDCSNRSKRVLECCDRWFCDSNQETLCCIAWFACLAVAICCWIVLIVGVDEETSWICKEQSQCLNMCKLERQGSSYPGSCNDDDVIGNLTDQYKHWFCHRENYVTIEHYCVDVTKQIITLYWITCSIGGATSLVVVCMCACLICGSSNTSSHNFAVYVRIL